MRQLPTAISCVAAATLAPRATRAFVAREGGPRQRPAVDTRTRQMSIRGAIASPLDQIKLDFVGSLENAYDLNPTNSASTSFLSRLVDQVRACHTMRKTDVQTCPYQMHCSLPPLQATPESITREILESFEHLSVGRWRVVYIDEYSTSFGFGSLFGDLSAAEFEVGNDGSITSCVGLCI